MIETTVSIIIVSILLIGSLETLTFAVRSTARNQERLLANCFAEQLYSEISILNFIDPSENTHTLGTESSETDKSTRIQYDDIDDYNGMIEGNLMFRDGILIPNSTGWTRSVIVEAISPDNPGISSPISSHLRKLTITLRRNESRVYTFAYLISRDGFRTPASIPTTSRATWESEWNHSEGIHNLTMPLRNHPETVISGF